MDTMKIFDLGSEIENGKEKHSFCVKSNNFQGPGNGVRLERAQGRH